MSLHFTTFFTTSTFHLYNFACGLFFLSIDPLYNRHGLLDPDHLNNDAATVQNRLAIIGGIDAKPNALPLNAINLKS